MGRRRAASYTTRSRCLRAPEATRIPSDPAPLTHTTPAPACPNLPVLCVRPAGCVHPGAGLCSPELQPGRPGLQGVPACGLTCNPARASGIHHRGRKRYGHGGAGQQGASGWRAGFPCMAAAPQLYVPCVCARWAAECTGSPVGCCICLPCCMPTCHSAPRLHTLLVGHN